MSCARPSSAYSQPSIGTCITKCCDDPIAYSNGRVSFDHNSEFFEYYTFSQPNSVTNTEFASAPYFKKGQFIRSNRLSGILVSTEYVAMELTPAGNIVPFSSNFYYLNFYNPVQFYPPANGDLMTFTTEITPTGTIVTGTYIGNGAVGTIPATISNIITSARFVTTSVAGVCVFQNKTIGSTHGAGLYFYTLNGFDNSIVLSGTWVNGDTISITVFACGELTSQITQPGDGMYVVN